MSSTIENEQANCRKITTTARVETDQWLLSKSIASFASHHTQENVTLMDTVQFMYCHWQVDEETRLVDDSESSLRSNLVHLSSVMYRD